MKYMVVIQASLKKMETSLKIYISGPEFVAYHKNKFSLIEKNNLPSSVAHYQSIAKKLKPLKISYISLN